MDIIDNSKSGLVVSLGINHKIRKLYIKRDEGASLMRHYLKRHLNKLKKIQVVAAIAGVCVTGAAGIHAIDVQAQDYSLRVDSDNQWKYFNDDDIIDTEYTGLALNEYGWWYIKNGIIEFD